MTIVIYVGQMPAPRRGFAASEAASSPRSQSTSERGCGAGRELGAHLQVVVYYRGAGLVAMTAAKAEQGMR
jgi:hypothetical protein